MEKIFLDFETFYDSQNKYSLKHQSIVEYINDDRFKVLGLGLYSEVTGYRFLKEKDIPLFFKNIENTNAAFVAHNIKFDGSILAWKYNAYPKQYIDTQSMANAVFGDSIPSTSLKYLGEYFKLPEKGTLNTDGKIELSEIEWDELRGYCLRDVELCQKIYNELEPQIPESQWQLIDWTARCFICPKLEIDHVLAGEVYKELTEIKEKKIAESGIDKKVLSSNPQFALLLSSKGYQVPMKKSKTGNIIPALSVSDPEFITMSKSDDATLRSLCELRIEAKKTMEVKRAQNLSFFDKFTKYPFDIVFSGAKQTHRFAGGGGAGGNPQNFPRKSRLRECVSVPKGHKLLIADFSNIELRILAFLSKDYHLTTAIKNKEDVYCQFGTKLYKRTITKNDKKERQLSKAAVLGLGYGLGVKKFITIVETQVGEKLDYFEAKKVIDLYRSTYIGVPRFWKSMDQVLSLINKGIPCALPGFPAIEIGKDYLELPSGLQLKYSNLHKEDDDWQYTKYSSKQTIPDSVKIYGGKLTENICQALAGEVCKEAISRLIDAGYSPQGQVHDELLLVVDEKGVDKAREAMYTAMTDPISWWPELLLDVEIGVGDNWLEAK